jgi:hypothetical protein
VTQDKINRSRKHETKDSKRGERSKIIKQFSAQAGPRPQQETKSWSILLLRQDMAKRKPVTDGSKSNQAEKKGEFKP